MDFMYESFMIFDWESMCFDTSTSFFGVSRYSLSSCDMCMIALPYTDRYIDMHSPAPVDVPSYLPDLMDGLIPLRPRLPPSFHLCAGSDAIGFSLLHHLPRRHLLVHHLIQLPLLPLLPHLPLLLQELLLLLRRQVLQQRHIHALRDIPMKRPDHAVHVVDGQLSDIRHGLDFGGALLELLVRHVDVQLHGAALDGVPPRQARGEVHVAGEAEVGGVDDLVGGWVVEDRLGVDAGLVGEGAEAGDGVVEGDVDLDGLRDEVLDVFEFREFVLGHDVVAVHGDHACHEAAEGGDAVALLGWGVSGGRGLWWGGAWTYADAEDGCVDVGGAGFEGAVSVGDGAVAVVVEVRFDVTAYDASEGSDEIVDLPWGCAAYGVGDTDAVDTDFVDGGVDGEEIDKVGAEGVFG